ncbi:MAG TPA: RES domain-containing protein [Longimicrobium sp.]|nr:RES domain-containing protein [Longimicrobium sp.]
MPLAYRTTKTRHPVYDGTGAALIGGRWNSPGRPVIYCADSFAGSILEILAHANRPLRVPGPHHAAQIEFPDDLAVEILDEAALPEWNEESGAVSREFGDRWMAEARTPILSVPAATARPFGRNLMINPAHPDATRIRVSVPVMIEWDVRLFTP